MLFFSLIDLVPWLWCVVCASFSWGSGVVGLRIFFPFIVVHEGAESVSRADSFKKILRLCASKDIANEIICRSLASSGKKEIVAAAMISSFLFSS